MNPRLYFLITQLQYVINFVGADTGGRNAVGTMIGTRGFVRPKPITDAEFERIIGHTRVAAARAAEAEAVAAAGPAVDALVEMTEGPFKGLRGPVLAAGDGEVEVSLVVT